MSSQLDPDLVTDLDQFIHDYLRDQLAEVVQSDAEYVEIDYKTLRRARPHVADDYLVQPVLVRDHIKAAIEEHDFPVPEDFSDISVRVVNVHESAEDVVRDVGQYSPSEIAGEFTSLRGQVTKRSAKTIRLETIVWECQRCGHTSQIPQPDNEIQQPHECQGCERQGPFRINEDKTEPYQVDHQVLRLQTLPEEGQAKASEHIDVVAEDDLVDQAKPGDRVVAHSTIERELQEDQPEFEIYGDAEAIDRLDSDFSSLDISEYRDRIEEIAANNPVEQVTESIAPRHYGHDAIKKTLALQLVSGPDLEMPDGSVKRGAIHVFLVGDPGVGKSKLLRRVKDIAPRSVFTTGAGSTRVGLTAAAVQDDFGGGGWTIEAGALVKAHEGICCIDELDDMSEEDRAGLLEAMSDQEINVSKAGMNPTLPANTTVLAAANPEHGRFDTYEPLGDQVAVVPALISRFDLVFTLTDEVDAEQDGAVADMINKSIDVGQANERNESSEFADDVTGPIDDDTLRAYIAYARRQVPRVTSDAMQAVKNTYQSIRTANDDDGPIPTTPRMVEALHRLSAAHARLRLSDEVTTYDVDAAADIVFTYLKDVGIDPESGELDADIVETGRSTSQRDRINRIHSLIASLAEEYDRGAPEDVVVDRAEEQEIDADAARGAIEKLKEEGRIYEPQSGHLFTS